MREITIENGKSSTEASYPDNYVTTSRYTLWNLLPKNLYEQFQRIANIWFLVIAILQLLPLNLSPSTNWDTIAPLAFILSITFIKDCYNDYRRHKCDWRRNGKFYDVWDGTSFTKVMSKEIRVGNILLLNNLDCSPADIIILASAHNDPFYSDDSNVLGQVGLNKKKAIKETQKKIYSRSRDVNEAMLNLSNNSYAIKVAQPVFSPQFVGLIKPKGYPTSIKISQESWMHKESVISGTPWIIGVVAYTGIDAKSQLNIKVPQKKVSRIEKLVNQMCIVGLLILLVLVLFSTMMNYWLSTNDWDEDTNVIRYFVLFALLYNNIIPISLFVAMDLIRLLATYFIHSDLDMYDSRTDRTAVVNITDINEDLGQVEYIFTGKSALIGNHDLYLKVAYIAGTVYGAHETVKNTRIHEDHTARKDNVSISPTTIGDFSNSGQYTSDPHPSLKDEYVKNDLYLNDKRFDSDILDPLKSEAIEQFLECMSICNNCRIRKSGNYFSPEPEDLLFAEAASCYGMRLDNRSSRHCTIATFKGEIKYNIIGLREQSRDSTISGIVLQCEDGSGKMFVKGEYQAMIKKLQHRPFENVGDIAKDFATDGYRPIVMATRQLTAEQVQDFHKRYENASASVINVETKTNLIFSEYETELELVGIAALRQQVDRNALDTIRLAKEAGIKVWMMTGDQEDDTLATAYSSGLIGKSEDVERINHIGSRGDLIRVIKRYITHDTNILPPSSAASDSRPVGSSLKSALSSMQVKDVSDKSKPPDGQSLLASSGLSRIFGGASSQGSIPQQPSLSTVKSANQLFKSLNTAFKQIVGKKPQDEVFSVNDLTYNPEDVDFSVSLSGNILDIVMKDDEMLELLMLILFCANSVVAHNLFPSQKAQLVQMVKGNFSFKPVTLGIGNSDSDIAMVQMSDVGVGIAGEEQTHISIVAEFSIQRWGHLKYLIFKHGRYNYYRMSKTVLLFIYKNFFLTILYFGYIFLNDYSGATYFDGGFLLFYNILFTTIPLIVIGLLDQDLPIDMVTKYAATYYQGISSQLFGWTLALRYYLYGIVHALIISFLIIGSSWNSIINQDGHTEELNTLGPTLFIALVFTVLCQIIIDTGSFSVIYIISILLSVGFLFLYLAIITYVPYPTSYFLGVLFEIFDNPVGVVHMFLAPMVCLVLSYLVKAFQVSYRPTEIDQVILGLIRPEQIPSHDKSRLEEFCENASSLRTKKIAVSDLSDTDSYDQNKLNLKFKSSHVEKSFKNAYIDDHISVMRWVIRIIFIAVVLWFVLELLISSITFAFLLTRAVVIMAYFVIVVYTSTRNFRDNYVRVTITILFVLVFFKFLIEIFFLREGGLASAMVPAITFILFNVDWILITIVNIASIILSLISLIVHNALQDRSSEMIAMISIYYILFLVAITFVSGFVGYWLERAERKEFKLIKTIESKIEQSQNCLSCMLPKFVKDRVKEGSRYIADDQGEVTVIFCDIVDFDLIFAQYEPADFISLLDELWQKFDQLCDQDGVVKIETVSKTYMACAGLKDNLENLTAEQQAMSHGRRAIEFGLDVIRAWNSIRLKNGDSIRIKIGINTGTVTAGVVGHHKPQFSLVGDTVNTASRMGSTLPFPNTIQISMSTYNLVNDPLPTHLNFKSYEVEAKGKGTLQTFLVTENDDVPDVGESLVKDDETEVSSELNGRLSVRQQSVREHSIKSQQTLGVPTRGSRRNSAAVQQTLSLSSRKSVLLNKVGLTGVDDMGKNKPAQESKGVSMVNQSIGKSFVYSGKETEAQKEFRIKRMKAIYSQLFWGMVVTVVVYAILLVLTLAAVFTIKEIAGMEILAARLAAFFILVTIFSFLKFINIKSFYMPLMSVAFVVVAIFGMFNIIFDSDLPDDILTIEVFYNLLMITHISGVFLNYATISLALILIPWLIVASLLEDAFVVLGHAIFLVVFIIINFIALYNRESHQRQLTNLKTLATDEIKKTDSLIEQMMPKHVYDNIKEEKSVTDKLTNVTMLYADIVGFTNWSSDKTPPQVVEMLSNLFKAFDQLWEYHNLYKVHTIGDCYVVMGYKGEKNQERDYKKECMSMIDLSFSMVEVIQTVNAEQGIDLDMRIGLHTGEVIAGITGTNLIRYDIYGPDNMLANKMESGGMQGKINVSDVTKGIMEEVSPHRFSYDFNKKIEVKTVERSHDSYFIEELH